MPDDLLALAPREELDAALARMRKARHVNVDILASAIRLGQPILRAQLRSLESRGLYETRADFFKRLGLAEADVIAASKAADKAWREASRA